MQNREREKRDLDRRLGPWLSVRCELEMARPRYNAVGLTYL
jgi:hypothetical protein